DVIAALHLPGQREERLRLRPGFVDQRGVATVIGGHREAEAFARRSEILCELVGGRRHGNDGNGSGHAMEVRPSSGGGQARVISPDLGAGARGLKGKRRFRPARASAKPAAMAKQYWLMKSEPDAYAWDQLVKDGTGIWDGVRNHTAKLNMMAMKKGDEALF